MRQNLQSIWRSASMCLFMTPLAVIFGGIALTGAFAESFSNFADSCRNVGSNCHDPRGWVIIPLGLLGLALLALAATMLVRGLFLIGRGLQRKLSAG
jgi:hypothetical protein